MTDGMRKINMGQFLFLDQRQIKDRVLLGGRDDKCNGDSFFLNEQPYFIQY